MCYENRTTPKATDINSCRTRTARMRSFFLRPVAAPRALERAKLFAPIIAEITGANPDMSPTAIADELNRRKVPTPTNRKGGRWYGATVIRIRRRLAGSRANAGLRES
jgi:hypothetical protein